MAPISPAADRLAGLPRSARDAALRARAAIARGEASSALQPIESALKSHPNHPELMQLRGLVEHHAGRAEAAVAWFRRAAAAWPDDAIVRSNLGAALAQSGDLDAAIAEFRRAVELDPSLADAWFNLGRALERKDDASGAYAAFSAVVELAPHHPTARVLRAEAAKTLGRVAEAESDLRAVVREDSRAISAWIALANMKTARLDASDVAAMQSLHDDARLAPERRVELAFALGNALEASGDYPRAFAMFSAANAAKRKTIRWDADAVSKLVDDILAAFDAGDDTGARGSDVVFLVGMARSGSTLAEQILAAHPGVAAGGESGIAAALLQAESVRRRTRFPYWVRDASDDDWTRLGESLLARIAALRAPGKVFTDKTLTNWQTLGAIRRMLPGARIVHCRRDALETLWSCFKHDFEQQLYSYDLDELARFYRDGERAMAAWRERWPGWIHEHRHETLIADPEATVRALLAHCGLEFDPACLAFHAAEREVRTASAAQVRRPLQPDRGVARRYGDLLASLKRAVED